MTSMTPHCRETAGSNHRALPRSCPAWGPGLASRIMILGTNSLDSELSDLTLLLCLTFRYLSFGEQTRHREGNIIDANLMNTVNKLIPMPAAAHCGKNTTSAPTNPNAGHQTRPVSHTMTPPNPVPYGTHLKVMTGPNNNHRQPWDDAASSCSPAARCHPAPAHPFPSPDFPNSCPRNHLHTKENPGSGTEAVSTRSFGVG